MRAALAGEAPAPTAPLRDQLAWLRSQPLVVPQFSPSLCFEPEALADEIGLTVNLSRFEARELGQSFVHRSTCLLAGDIAFSSASYMPLVASTSDYSESSFEIPYWGTTRYRIEGSDWFNRAGQQALYLPGQAFEVETSHFNGLLFNLSPARLAATIGQVSQRRVPLELAERWVQRPVAIDLGDPRVIHLQRRLEAGLARLAEHNGQNLGDPSGAAALELETLAYQTSARMLLVSLWGHRSEPI